MTAVAVSAQLGTVTVETQDCLAAYAVIDAPGRPRRVLQFGALVQRQAIGDRLRRDGLPVTDLRESENEDGETVLTWTLPRD